MTVALGVMQVPAGEDGDSNRRYLNGTLPDGGLWTAPAAPLRPRPHGGPERGAHLGGLAPRRLDHDRQARPDVLAPYALVDGSKPFTGQVTMEQDAGPAGHAVLRQQGSAAPADADLSRAGPGVLTTTSRSCACAAWSARWGTGRPRRCCSTTPGATTGRGCRATRPPTSPCTWARRRDPAPGDPQRLHRGAGAGDRRGPEPRVADTRWLARDASSPLDEPRAGAPGREPDPAGRPGAHRQPQHRRPQLPGLRRAALDHRVQPERGQPVLPASTKAGVAPLDLDASMEAVRTTVPVEFDYATPPPGPEGYELAGRPRAGRGRALPAPRRRARAGRAPGGGRARAPRVRLRSGLRHGRGADEPQQLVRRPPGRREADGWRRLAVLEGV